MSRTNDALSRKRKADRFECAELVPDEDLLYLFDLNVLTCAGGQDFPELGLRTHMKG